MSAPQKLTKKQKKSLTFRQKKGKGKAAAVDDEERDVPVLENLDLDTEDASNPKDEESFSVNGPNPPSALKKGKHKDGGVPAEQEDVETVRAESKKRKRPEKEAMLAGVEDRSTPKPKKPKRAPESKEEDSESVEGKAVTKGKKPRYILFVGNLKYTTSKEIIEKHFAACDPPPQVRLLTPKSTAKITTKSKGCAFLEFSHRNALQQALKLHQSELDGRRINVELTAGGGGKSEARLEKVKSRNKGLASQRTKRIQKQDGAEQDLSIERPQRHSTTSGMEEIPLKKRTWTIDDSEDGQSHRGGKKHEKTRGPKRKAKDWGTGVNSIPVG